MVNIQGDRLLFVGFGSDTYIFWLEVAAPTREQIREALSEEGIHLRGLRSFAVTKNGGTEVALEALFLAKRCQNMPNFRFWWNFLKMVSNRARKPHDPSVCKGFRMVPGEGLEPSLSHEKRILSTMGSLYLSGFGAWVAVIWQ